MRLATGTPVSVVTPLANMDNQIYDMFASPASPLDSEIATTITKTHVDAILSKVNTKLLPEQQWFTPLTKNWIKQNQTLQSLWHPAFSQLECDLKNNNKIQDTHLIAASFAIHESATANQQWQLQTNKHHHRFKQFCMPSESRINALSNTTQSQQFQCNNNRYQPESTSILDTVTFKHDIIFDTRTNSSPDSRFEKLPYPIASNGWNKKLWQDAYALLTESAPQYAHWSQQLLNTIVPLDAPKGYQISASHWHRRGEVLMSWRIKPHQLAEMLVHEASHQHFFMAGMLSPYDDGSDKTLYYSPVVKKKRPLTKILLAYHAFANVVLFFRLCKNYLPAADQRWLETEEKKVMSELELLEQPLRHSKSLTQLGQQLWQTLAIQIHEELK